ncbi:coiled-coil domain-containing protein [Streptosporangium sandarakinum]|uniref:coiled-coil domain-containing protein n=1 Tax=Streptosporangium TaxID=2000 RepID=UPI0031F7D2D3
MAAVSREVRRRGAIRGLVASITAATLCLGPAGAGLAEPKPTAKQLRKELADMQKQSESLIARYYDSRVELQKVQKTEKAARDRLSRAQGDLDRAAREIRLLAAARYRSSGTEGVSAMMGSGDPAAMLNRLTLVEQIVAEQDAKLRVFVQVRDDHRRARDEAKTRGAELKASMAKLDDEKDRAEKLIEKIKDRIDLLYPTPGVRRADGTWVPQLPSGPDNITPRMRLTRQLVAQRFGPRFGIGCFRVDGGIAGGGEHPLGRACDFMLSGGGAMPSAAETGRGDEIAAWAIKNARRLGIMYIIYRQRIWQTRTGSWRAMSNRGGVTANHFDHVHISVY